MKIQRIFRPHLKDFTQLLRPTDGLECPVDLPTADTSRLLCLLKEFSVIYGLSYIGHRADDKLYFTAVIEYRRMLDFKVFYVDVCGRRYGRRGEFLRNEFMGLFSAKYRIKTLFPLVIVKVWISWKNFKETLTK